MKKLRDDIALVKRGFFHFDYKYKKVKQKQRMMAKKRIFVKERIKAKRIRAVVFKEDVST